MIEAEGRCKPVYTAEDDLRYVQGVALYAAARAWLGTPYLHAQRSRGVGVDCVNLVVCAAVDAGLMRWDEWDLPIQYSAWVNADNLRTQIERLLDPVPSPEDGGERWTGDVILLRIRSSNQHVALYKAADDRTLRPRILHASMSDGKVVETDYEKSWRSRTVARFRWKLGVIATENAQGVTNG